MTPCDAGTAAVSEPEQAGGTNHVQLSNVSKAFDAVLAVDEVSFEFRGGEVHALLGENGAGKSTVIRLLAGDHRPDSGEILLDGELLALHHPKAAFEHGIACVHQVPMFVSSLSVTENLFLGLPYDQRRAGLIKWASEHRAAGAVLAKVGLSMNPRLRAQELAPHERQFLALARALQHEPRVLLLDEITASLPEPEVEMLYDVIRRVRDRGVAVVYVSHRLEEVFAIADRATVLRDGRHVATVPVAGLTHRRLTELIVGREIDEVEQSASGSQRAPGSALVARNIGDGQHTRGVSFDLRAGEVLGIAGLAGSGQSNVLRLLFGAVPLREGEILLEGERYRPSHPAEAIAARVVMVTEDRQADGFVHSLPVWQNTTLPWLRSFRRGGLLRLDRERAEAERQTRRFGVRMPSIDASMTQLSGGNQQKVILAKWMFELPRVLLLDQPTRGVDIRSRFDIYEVIRGLAAQGVAIMVTSPEFEEFEALCDRVLLIRAGRLIGEVSGSDVTKDAILSALLSARDSPVERNREFASQTRA
jgi:ABC-type sugar transport system ATPase subunit